MWIDAGKHTLLHGDHIDSRDGGCLEVLGYHGFIMQPSTMGSVLLNPRRLFDPTYAAAELLWYLSGSDDDRLVAYAPGYERFLDGGRANGAYGARMTHTNNGNRVSQLRWLVDLLKSKPESRQAVISLWWPTDLHSAIYAKFKDVPCTLCMCFHLRKNMLHMHVHMRSNDLWMGMPYDVFCMTMIQQLIADELGAQVGMYHHVADSLHVYDRDRAKLIEAVNLVPPVRPEWQPWPKRSSLEMASRAVTMEVGFRTNTSSDLKVFVSQNTMLMDMVRLVGRRWKGGPETKTLIESNIHNQALVKALQQKEASCSSSRDQTASERPASPSDASIAQEP